MDRSKNMVVNIAFYENVFLIFSLFRTRELTPASCKSYLAPRNQRPAPRTPHPAPRTPHPAPRILEKLFSFWLIVYNCCIYEDLEVKFWMIVLLIILSQPGFTSQVSLCFLWSWIL